MSLEYEIYKDYDAKAKREIDVEDYVSNSISRLEMLLEFLTEYQEDFLDAFIQSMIERLQEDEKTANTFELVAFIDKQLEKFPLLKSNISLGDKTVRFVLDELNLGELSKKATVLLLESEKGENLILYHAIKAMVDHLGREEGIHLYKDFINHRVEHLPAKEQIDFHEARVSWIKGMADSGGYAFAIYDFDESKFLGRFNKCVVHESLKDMDDSTLGYYVTCYAGLVGCNHSDWCVRMRRTQTLFTADFCDELYWDRHKYDNPEQPSLEFTRQLVVE